MDRFFDADGNWIAAGEPPSFPLGPGAGTVRARELCNHPSILNANPTPCISYVPSKQPEPNQSVFRHFAADNMDQFFDADGNWIAAGEPPSFPLGPGAGTVRVVNYVTTQVFWTPILHRVFHMFLQNSLNQINPSSGMEMRTRRSGGRRIDLVQAVLKEHMKYTV
jgi:hypothetical protein